MSYEWATVKEKVEWMIRRVNARYEISKKPEIKQELDDLNEVLGTIKRVVPDDLKSTEEYVEQLSQDVDEFIDEQEKIREEFSDLKTKQKHVS